MREKASGSTCTYWRIYFEVALAGFFVSFWARFSLTWSCILRFVNVGLFPEERLLGYGCKRVLTQGNCIRTQMPTC